MAELPFGALKRAGVSQRHFIALRALAAGRGPARLVHNSFRVRGCGHRFHRATFATLAARGHVRAAGGSAFDITPAGRALLAAILADRRTTPRPDAHALIGAELAAEAAMMAARRGGAAAPANAPAGGLGQQA